MEREILELICGAIDKLNQNVMTLAQANEDFKTASSWATVYNRFTDRFCQVTSDIKEIRELLKVMNPFTVEEVAELDVKLDSFTPPFAPADPNELLKLLEDKELYETLHISAKEYFDKKRKERIRPILTKGDEQ